MRSETKGIDTCKHTKKRERKIPFTSIPLPPSKEMLLQLHSSKSRSVVLFHQAIKHYKSQLYKHLKLVTFDSRAVWAASFTAEFSKQAIQFSR